MTTKYVSGRVKELKIGVSNYSESKESLSVVGIVSATKYYGDGSNLTGTSSPGIDTAGTSDFSTVNVSTLLDVDGYTELDDVNVSGISTFNNDVQFKGASYNALWDEATSKLKFYDLTQATFGDGNDLQIYSDGTNGIIQGNDKTNIIGITSVIATKFYGDGSGLTNVPVVGIDTTGTSDFTDLVVSGNLNVSGVSTFAGDITANGNIAGDGSTNITGIDGVTASGDITANGNIVGDNSTNISGIASVTATSFHGDGSALTGIDATALKDAGGNIKAQANPSGVVFTGIITGNGSGLTNVSVAGIDTSASSDFTDLVVSGNLNVSGLSTFAGAIDANGGADISGGTGLTASSAKISDLTNGRVVYAGASGELQDSANLTFDGTTLTANAFSGDGSALTNLPGIDTTGGSVFTNIYSTGINTLGKGASGVTYLYHADSLKFQTTGIGVSVASGTGKTAYIEGPEEIWIDPHPTGVGATSGIVRIRGDLYVDGTETIIDVEKLEIGDFQIGIATTAGTNAQLDGAGIGIGSTGIRKSITWNNATSALMTSENWNLASGKHYEIAGTDVLSASTLGSGVVNSSLTSLGTIASLTASTAKVSDLTNTRVVYAGASGELQDSANLTFDGTTLTGTFAGDGSSLTNVAVTGINTSAGSDFTDLTVSGNFKVTGISTFTGDIQANGDLVASTAKVSDLTVNRVVYVGASGELQDSSNFGYNGVSLSVNGINVTGNILAPNAGNFVAIGTENALGAGTDRLALLGSGTDSGVRIWCSQAVHKATAVPFQVATSTGTELFRVHADGNIGIGSDSPSQKLDVAGTVKATDFDSTSDIRLKTNVQVIKNPLDKVIQIEGVSFNWKENNKPALGVIADQVQKIIPELVHGDNPKTVNYNGLIGLLIEAVKEQQIQIDELKSKLS